MNWPDGARCAVMLTFDFDAETLWLARDPENARRPGVLSMGSYGAQRGVPEILKLLGEYSLPATFFTPGWTIEKYQDRIHAILEGGHEIAHHGYLHERVDPDKPDAERESILRGLESFDKVIGKRPTGYRSPAGETTPTLMGLLHEQGILYDSSLMADIVPYRHRLADGKPGLLELPWHWGCDDAPYMMFALQAWRPQFTNQQVFENWRDEFNTIYEWNGLFNLVMHPQFIGRPMRLPLLRRIVGYIRSKPGVWFATGHQTASQWAARNE